jgi:formate hydrogenlyase subunit 3/multisubunit Na+/H+ antiporter MnhD subunit
MVRTYWDVQLLPFTYGMILIGSMSLAGFPFLTGFYSKCSVLEVGYATYTPTGNFGYWLTAVFHTNWSYQERDHYHTKLR